MKRIKYLLLALIVSGFVFAQNENWFYATIDRPNAEMLMAAHPDKVQFIHSHNGISAVYLESEAALSLKDYGNLHGPGYIFRENENDALAALTKSYDFTQRIFDFDISEDVFVNQCIAMVDEENIGNTILDMEAYGTRYHSKAPGVQASIDLKDRWSDMAVAAGRADISVVNYDHDFTGQKSVILTIPGSENPDEIVIIGGHLDSGDFWIQDNAPGADDNGSGIAVLTETLRVLLTNEFYPKKTVQIMGYAAEEIGLLGSADIAETYSADNKDVLAVLQFDMTNYNGSSYDIALISDPDYTSSILNLYLIDLMEHYNASGEHQITYGATNCGYACSDHVSWTENGYLAAFPFEAAFGQYNPFIHSPNDTFAMMNNDASHSVKFVKLALEFVIETAKTTMMGTQELNAGELAVTVKNRQLIYQFSGGNSPLNSVTVLDASARKLIFKDQLQANGVIALNGLSSGVYIAVFKSDNGKVFTKKFLVR